MSVDVESATPLPSLLIAPVKIFAANALAVHMLEQGRANVTLETLNSWESGSPTAKTFALNCFVGKTKPKQNIKSVQKRLERSFHLKLLLFRARNWCI